MSLTVEDRAALRPTTCATCGSPLHATIVGPRCPIHGADGVVTRPERRR
ncbi:hypothetical protein [Amnibacterium endophyticum]|uniref:Uncharacterized protein n=1 Tax=Amnibacterium endophyticum TaxID=2109337 RepID=A0ABW4LEV6_9MICO